MARIPRVTQSIFAGSATNNGQFGSAQLGTFNLTNVLSTIMALPAWAEGWLAAVIGGSKFPPLEEFQAVQYVHSTQTAYLLQQGIPEYDPGTTYYVNNICVNPGTLQLYGSAVDNNTGNSLSNPAYWTLLLDLSNVQGVSTGDIKPTFKSVADNGWILMNDQTIGSAASGANYANAAAQNLFTLLWTNVSNTYAPVSGGRGASAAADWAANKTLQLPLALGRALCGAGAGSGLTSRPLGGNYGSEALAQHTHTITDPSHFHTVPGFIPYISGSGFGGTGTLSSAGGNTNTNTTGITVNNAGTGSAGNIQPSFYVNFMLKL